MRTNRRRRGITLLLGPSALGVLVLVLLPLVVTAGLAFTNATGLGGGSFIGLGNLRRGLEDPLLRSSLRASLVYVVLAVPLRFLAAAGLGLVLARDSRLARWARAAVFIPTVMPTLALSLVFLWLFNPVLGPVNQVLGALGLPQPAWFSTPAGAMTTILVMLLFPIGEAFVVVLAARRSIDPALYDAAAIDGAGGAQTLRYVTLPVLAPLLALVVLRDTVLSLQSTFVPAYFLTDGGPDASTLFLPIYVFDQSFEFLSAGYGAFLTLLLLLITLLFLIVEALVIFRARP